VVGSAGILEAERSGQTCSLLPGSHSPPKQNS
jgi:hypothetical protein